MSHMLDKGGALGGGVRDVHCFFKERTPSGAKMTDIFVKCSKALYVLLGMPLGLIDPAAMG